MADGAAKGALDPAIPVAALQEHLRGRLGGDATIVSAAVAGEGMSDDTWMLTVATAAGSEDLVLRRYRSGGALREETDPERHFRTLVALAGSAVPAPEALWLETDPDIAGGPFFAMRRVPGKVVVPWTRPGREFLAAAGEGPLGELFVSTLATIHAIPWRGSAFDFLVDQGPGLAGADAVARTAAMRAAVERYRLDPEPVLVDALCWLEANPPAQPRTTVVHGDYRTGNIVFAADGEGIAAVLDWEFARIGDPAADLAWVLCRTNRMDSDLACYLMPRERVLELYHRHAGWVPDEAGLHYWEVLHLVLNTCLWLSAEFNYARGATADLKLARWTYTLPKMRGMVLDALEEA